MNDKTTVVLLIEDDPADARLIKEALSEEVDSPFRVEWVTRLSDGLDRLSRERVDVVMLDLSCPTFRASMQWIRYVWLRQNFLSWC